MRVVLSGGPLGGAEVTWPKAEAQDGTIKAYNGWLYRLDLASAQGTFMGAE